jgi:secondary thiamine-phosphate synthase enzyme
MILNLRSSRARECIEITDAVRDVIRKSGVRRGICHVMALHATAAIVINENDDPNIGLDLLDALEKLVPAGAGWRHDRVDNNAHAHIQAAMLGPQEIVPVEEGDLLLGTWQGILLVELDGPRSRRNVSVQVIPVDEPPTDG